MSHKCAGLDPSKGGGVTTRPTLTSEQTPPWRASTHTQMQTHTHCGSCWQEHKGAAATDVEGEGRRRDINGESLSGVEFSVELIVFSKDQDKGIDHINIVSLCSLLHFLFCTLLTLTVQCKKSFQRSITSNWFSFRWSTATTAQSGGYHGRISCIWFNKCIECRLTPNEQRQTWPKSGFEANGGTLMSFKVINDFIVE